MVTIKDVIQRSDQGMTKPFLCRASDNAEYYVKSGSLPRFEQAAEWICGNIAKSLGLPIADFKIVEIPQILYEALPSPLKEIGYGYAFASRRVNCTTWLEQENVKLVPVSLRRKIVAFDFLVKNMDRLQNNTNLLYDFDNNKLVIIDHNLAFDREFDIDTFVKLHIFSSDFSEILHDWCLQKELEEELKVSIDSCQKAIDSIPSDWYWKDLEQTIPSDIDYQYITQLINRINFNDFWSIK